MLMITPDRWARIKGIAARHIIERVSAGLVLGDQRLPVDRGPRSCIHLVPLACEQKSRRLPQPGRRPGDQRNLAHANTSPDFHPWSGKSRENSLTGINRTGEL